MQIENLSPQEKLQYEKDNDNVVYKVGEFYLNVFECTDGYDYTLYNADLSENDGGIYDDTGISLTNAIDYIAEDFVIAGKQSLIDRTAPMLDVETFIEQVEKVSLQKQKNAKLEIQVNEILKDPDALVEFIYKNQFFEEKLNDTMALVELKNMLGEDYSFAELQSVQEYCKDIYLKYDDVQMFEIVSFATLSIKQSKLEINDLLKISQADFFEAFELNDTEYLYENFIKEDAEQEIIQLHEKSDNIEVDEHIGTWYVIDTTIVNGTKYFLLEHEEYGDETSHIIVDTVGTLVLGDVYNGFDDLAYHFESLETENHLKTAEISTETNYNMIDGVINNEPPKNSGYFIIDTFIVGDNEVALGYNENAPSQYATWERNMKNDGDDNPNYYFGHYTNDKDKAYKDFESRIKNLISDIPSLKDRLDNFKNLADKLKSAVKKDREIER